MKTKLGALLVALTLMLGMAVSAGAQGAIDEIEYPKLNEIKTPDIKQVVLDNGLRLYLLEDHALPLVRASLRVNTGSYLDPPNKVGLASMTSDLLRIGGTEKWTSDEIDEMLEGVGASVETGMDVESASASMNVLTEYTDMGLEVLAQVLRYPVFDDEKMNLAITQAKSGISRRNEDPYDMTRREWVKKLYGGSSPYARQSEYATIDAISRDDLVAFHSMCYRPENVQMAIYGDIDPDAIVEKINAHFGDWERGTQSILPPPDVPRHCASPQVYVIHKPDLQQATVRMGHIGGLVSDPDYADRIVMNAILGGGFGSRILDVVRVQMGLAYVAGGRVISNYTHPGYFFLYAQTSNASAVTAARAMIEQIGRMHTDPPTEAEMAKGKDGYLNSFVFNFDQKGEVMNRLMTYDFHGMPENFLQLEKQAVERVTPEAVVKTAKANLFPDSLLVVISGNTEEFEESVEALGFGIPDTIDVTIPKPAAELTINEEAIARGSEILARAAEAHGGEGNLKKVEAIRTNSTVTVLMGGQSFPVTVEKLEVPPNQHRSVVNMMGRQIFDVRDGEKGWQTGQTGLLEDAGAEALAEADKDLKRELLHILQHVDDPYYRAVFAGSEEFGGVAVDWVALVYDDGEEICRLAVAAESHQIVCQKYWGNSFMGEGMLEHLVQDVMETEGVILPKSVEVRKDGEKIMTVETTERAFNVAIPADAFAKPEI